MWNDKFILIKYEEEKLDTSKENPRFVYLAHLNFLALELHRQMGR
jgi:hypothetical protein